MKTHISKKQSSRTKKNLSKKMANKRTHKNINNHMKSMSGGMPLGSNDMEETPMIVNTPTTTTTMLPDNIVNAMHRLKLKQHKKRPITHQIKPLAHRERRGAINTRPTSVHTFSAASVNTNAPSTI